MPRTPCPAATAPGAAAAAARIVAASLVIRVGRMAVVPSLRCAAAIASAASAVGWSLNRRPPPPLTWMSMKPGARSASGGRVRRSQAGAASIGSTARMRPASISTPWPSQRPGGVRMSQPWRNCGVISPLEEGQGLCPWTPAGDKSPDPNFVCSEVGIDTEAIDAAAWAALRARTSGTLDLSGFRFTAFN